MSQGTVLLMLHCGQGRENVDVSGSVGQGSVSFTGGAFSWRRGLYSNVTGLMWVVYRQ